MPELNLDLKASKPRPGECNETDGFSVCTEKPGHTPPHWDERTQHEWADDPYAGENRTGNLWDILS